MNQQQEYHIGIPGQKWAEKEKQLWFSEQKIKRSYAEEVLAKLELLKEHFNLDQYGVITTSTNSYALYIVKNHDWDVDKATILITGGVHGYETSGVQGAIRFLETKAKAYINHFNILVAPCISPWGYETINRWNPKAIDPNRSFYKNSPVEESAALMDKIHQLNVNILVHLDLHETTDTDNSEFRPALAARDAVDHDNWDIPDGFYLVGHTIKPEADFQRAMIQSVEKVTHIAPADENNKIIGEAIEQFGVINYAAAELGLCMAMTEADFVTTTEVYPDSPMSNAENCIEAQVASITGALDYVIKTRL